MPGFAHMPTVEITGASLVSLPHTLQFIATRGGESSVGAPFLCKKTRFWLILRHCSSKNQ